MLLTTLNYCFCKIGENWLVPSYSQKELAGCLAKLGGYFIGWLVGWLSRRSFDELVVWSAARSEGQLAGWLFVSSAGRSASWLFGQLATQDG